MAQQRTLSEKVGDIKTTFAQFQEMLTSETKRQVLQDMTGSMQQFTVEAMQMAQEAGDLQLHANLIGQYAALVQASINLDKVISANDRAALIGAVLANQSGVARPMLDVIDGEA